LRLAQLLEAPRIAVLLFIPPVAFVAALAVMIVIGGGNGDAARSAALTVDIASIEPLVTEEPFVDPTTADRASCSEIEGTDYRSATEREWFQANCTLVAASADTGGVSAGSGSSSGATSVSGPNTVGGGEYALGDRLLIPSIGVDTTVNGITVAPNGVMANPVGYFNAVWYDFSSFPGLGGYTDGNLVLAGHVDSAVYGLAIFWYVRELAPGATIQYVTSGGEVINYVVTSSAAYDANSDFAPIVATGAADLTIITCTGTFSGHSYNLRHVVQAVRS
jgi:hypothetical protein